MRHFYILMTILCALIILPVHAMASSDEGTFLHTVKEKMADNKEKEDEQEKKTTHEDSGNPFFSNFIFRNLRTVGATYASFNVPVANSSAMSGFGFNLSTSYSYPISFSVESYFLTGTAPGQQLILNPTIVSGKLRLPMTEDMNFYGGIGYASTFGSVNGTTTQDSGFSYEAGVEYKLVPGLIANIGYKNIGITGGSLSGINGGINLIF